MSKQQCSLKRAIAASGRGVHTGLPVQLMLRPAPINTGIVFRRVDLDEPAEILAHVDHLADNAPHTAQFSTNLVRDGVQVGTVEHLMSALSGLGVDNLYVDLDAPELPIMDGSAAPFASLIQSAGIEAQEASKKLIKVKRYIEIREKNRWVSLEPCDRFKLAFYIDYEHPAIKASPQYIALDSSKFDYVEALSRARTFGFLSDYEYMRQHQLALGAGLENTLVLDEQGVMNKEGLRYPDEFVKHKALDAIGDLYLLGHSLLAQFKGHCSGHALNGRLLKKLLSDQQNWEYVEAV